MRKRTEWYRTGDCRVAPWWFGVMRAEFMERRDAPGYSGTMEDGTYQIRWVGAGRLPPQYDGPTASGFWSTMATPIGDTKTYGNRALWRGFVTYFRGERK